MKSPAGGKISRLNPTGGILLEAVFTLLPLLLVFLLFMEVIRREVLSIVMVHAACFEVRAKVLGYSPDQIQTEVSAFHKKMLGEVVGAEVYRNSQQTYSYVKDWEMLSRLKLGYGRGGLSERFYRYPQWVSFPFKRKSKHHQEVTQRCLFPF